MSSEKYFIGIDGGTSSVGWAVTTPDYQIVKKGGRELWGVRLFDTAQTAEKRRMARTARRRSARKNHRVKLLREIFAEEITKVDPSFYVRMDESFFWEEDKKVEGKYTLFSDAEWNDRDFFQKYPTVYHLRRELMRGKGPYDIRMVYLAIHHIIKHRGHFLFAGQSFDACMDFSVVWDEFTQCFEDVTGEEIELIDPETLKSVLTAKQRVNDKQKAIKKLIRCDYEGTELLMRLLAGATVDLAKVFHMSLEDDEKNALKLSFSGVDMENEEKVEMLSARLGDRFGIITHLKTVYDWGILTNILGSNTGGSEDYQFSLSDAKVIKWEKHRDDLKKLKKVIRSIAPERYAEVFRSVKKGCNNYCAYVGHSDRKSKGLKRCSQEDFYKYIRSIIGKTEDVQAKDILNEIDTGTFMPLQRSKENSVVPYQIHLRELREILDHASSYLSFLNDTDESGISVRDKIESLLTFRVPYYVGPLDNTNAKEGMHWAVKLKNEPVRPWNFHEVVDQEASAERFMEKLTNCCTYLIGEPVLPKNSIIYSRFMVLNEINNISIYGERLPVIVKQQMFEELFLNKKQVRRKDITNWLIRQGYISKTETSWIGGIDEDIKSTLKTEIRLREIFGDDLPEVDILEEIIKSILLLGQEPQMLKRRIRRFLPNITSIQLKKVCGMQVSGWGRLSRQFLCGLKAESNALQEKEYSIMDMLWETNENLMQLLSNRYAYSRLIEDYNADVREDNRFDYSMVDEMAVPPNVKRSIWQIVRITKEISEIMGADPSKIFVEMARGAEEKKRTLSRKQQLYNAFLISDDEMREYWCDEIESMDDTSFRRDALYLYFTQKGRCMYTGEPIDLGDILNKQRFDALYDIDHIWPQSKIKDDSIENRVLVRKTANQEKGDSYPIRADIRNRQKLFWEELYRMNLIGKKKLDRLTRRSEFSEQELAGFIERQLVETRQSTKAAAKLLQDLFPNSRIVYVKAGNVSDFRQKYGFIKVRELNDIHHAKDAYLNVVVGNVFDVKFTSNPWIFVHRNVLEQGEKYSLRPEIMYQHDVSRSGETAWKATKQGSIAVVNRMMKKNHPMITWQEVRRNSGQNGGLHDQNPVTGGSIPLKGGDPRYQNTERYGGYSGDTGAYMFAVEHGKRKKRVRSIETVYLRCAEEIEREPDGLLKYCVQVLKLEDPKVLIPEIKYNSLLMFGDFGFYITGRTEGRLVGTQAFQVILSNDQSKYLKAVIKVTERIKANRGEDVVIREQYDGVDPEKTLLLYDLFCEKLSTPVLQDRPAHQLETMRKGRKRFADLSLGKQCLALANILELFRAGGIADLTLIGGAKNAGYIKFAKDISKQKNIHWVTSSVTGFYHNVIDLQSL